ncbi:signal transduction histidine kinase [Herbihabitans rhizosphaerae]|uniref:histidine kinase n=1 Tax=Herbihabitans rhizosphaerae TaxID=1872711 RepID=A0A4Q7KHG0_9PSEU|nr:sensor histidine kinase [Herbihabitans rhizosphaerae]RZS33974.1 signal transduction histidine kinase [Herbihabitans rhizosphaerae]
MVESARHQVFTRRLSRRELVVLDRIAAVTFTAVFFVISNYQQIGAVPVPVRLGVAAIMGLPVAFRRRWPVPVLVVVAAASVLAAALGVLREPFLATAFALYLVGATVPASRWIPTSLIGLTSVIVLAGGLMVGSSSWQASTVATHVVGAALAGAAWTAGRAMHERRAYAARSVREVAASAVAEERLRIARELHDIVAHEVGLIAVKAGVANHVLARRPDEASAALRDIESASRSALAEMRNMLGVLRSEDEEAAADRRPGHGLERLPELVERASMAGVRVDIDSRVGVHLPEGVDRSAYRIVQEALTNVIKHAAPTTCTVTVTDSGGKLCIDVVDGGAAGHGPRRAPDRGGSTAGHGLIGMRERVALYGGTFDAGPSPDGGFAVSARLPFQRGDS